MNFKKILIFSSLYLPFAPLLEKYFPFQVFSNSFYITVLPIVTFFSLFLIKLKNFKSKDFYFLLVIVLSFSFIFCVRLLFYDSNFILEKLISNIFIFYPIIFIVCLRNLNFSSNDFKLISLILFLNIAFGSITGLLYVLGLETIMVADQGKLDLIITRFTGIYGGSNVYSNLMFTFYIILVLINRKNFFILISSSVLLIPVLISSGSRTPLILFLISILFLSMRKFNFKIIFYFIIFWISLFAASKYFLDFGLNNPFIRLLTLYYGDSGGRTDKLILAIELLLSSPISLLFGVKKSLLSQGVNVSDNSLTLILTSFGLIFSFLSIYFCLKISNIKFKIIKNSLSLKLYLFCMFCVFVFNNSILWMVWMYIFVLGLYLIYSNEKLLKNNV